MLACPKYPLVRALDAWVELRQTITSPWSWQSAISNLLVISSHIRESTEDSLGFWILRLDSRFWNLAVLWGYWLKVSKEGTEHSKFYYGVLKKLRYKIVLELLWKSAQCTSFVRATHVGKNRLIHTCSRNLCHAASSKILKVHKRYTSLTYKGSWFALVPLLT